MFLSKFASDDRSPYSDFWFKPVGGASLSGARVGADNAMCLSAVFRAVGLMSGHMAMLPVVFYQRGTRKRIAHPLLSLFNRRPNRWQTAYEWREMIQGHIELRGNAYNEIVSNARGQIVELIPRHPDKIKIEVMSDGDFRYIHKQDGGNDRVIPRGDMWHIKGLSSDGIVGLSVLEYARESFGVGLAAQSYGARFFANDAKPSSGWIEYPGAFADKHAKQVFRESVQDAQTAKNRGRMMVLDRGMKYHEIGITNDDAQFLETRQHQVTEVARWFGVPPHKLADLSKSAFSNIEQQALEYIQDALLPRASRLESSIEADLLFDDEEIDVEYDFAELMRGDSAQRSAYYHNGILDGWLTRNEAREGENREPIEGLDKPLMPLNMIEVGDDGRPIVSQQISPQKKKPDGDEAAAQRMKAMIRSNADRMARRAVKAGKLPESAVIAEAVAVPLNVAESWLKQWGSRALDEPALSASLVSLGMNA